MSTQQGTSQTGSKQGCITDDHSRQLRREQAQRDAAYGKRLAKFDQGHLDPVLKRWINADILPIAAMLRKACKLYLAGDLKGVGELLDLPTVELSGTSNPLRPLLEWCLRGRSKGRGGTKDKTTYAEDLVLVVMSSLVSTVVKDPVSSATSLFTAATLLKETVLGQCIADIQGATAMRAIRSKEGAAAWKQNRSMIQIGKMLTAQVRPEMLRRLEESEDGRLIGLDKVMRVYDQKGDERMITLRRVPDTLDWTILAITYRDEESGASDEHMSRWMGLTQLIFACAQRVGGWFAISKKRTSRKDSTVYLALSDKASEAIRKDVTRWLGLGFVAEPMVVPPEGGDYLSVKHKPVNGARPPKGMLTKAEGTAAWDNACILADSAWSINPYLLKTLRTIEDTLDGADLAQLQFARQDSQEPALYLPIFMDFRGRCYYRTTYTNPQRGDLGKGLLCFPKRLTRDPTPDEEKAVALHISGLWGLDKATLDERMAWWDEYQDCYPEALMSGSDKPYTLAACLQLWQTGEWDRIPVQLDGTCNGLQHLTAMFRDEQAAASVNLVPSDMATSTPADIYRAVALIVEHTLSSPEYADMPWVKRFVASGLSMGRKVTKKAVMTLPYGATLSGLKEDFKEVIAPLCPSDAPWRTYTADGYGAFSERELALHPLFRLDCSHLAGVVWAAISPTIPKAMAAMDALRGIGAFVGSRGLSWQTIDGLWVTQAKASSSLQRVTAKGFHMPEVARRFQMMKRTDDIAGQAQRTGIVPNFIHSQDATHLRLTLRRFRDCGGTDVGGVHDCLIVRPSEAGLMGECLRETFIEMYARDPLTLPVRLLVDKERYEEYESWYSLAEAAGVSFPDRGTYDINDVRQSAWFFS